MSCLSRFVVACGIVLASAPVWAAITYVDAVPNTNGSNGNTTVNGALVTLFDPGLGGTGNVTTEFANTDNLWHHRSHPDLNGGTAWQMFNDTEHADPLITTLSLAPGVYRLHGLFWSGAGGSFIVELRAGASGSYSSFDTGSSSTLSAADGSDFAGAVNTRGAFGDLRIATLGEFAVASSIDVYANGPLTPLAADPRTVFDGVGYEFVRPIPEPASMLMTALGALGLFGGLRTRCGKRGVTPT